MNLNYGIFRSQPIMTINDLAQTVRKDIFDSMQNVIKETKKAVEFQPKINDLFNEREQ